MISKDHRFHGRTSLRFVFNRGQTARGPLFAVKSVANPRRKDYRLAVVVSRKVHKSAVARNRVRRRLYEAIRLMEGEIGGPFDIVITVFSDKLIEADSNQIKTQLKKQLTEAGTLRR